MIKLSTILPNPNNPRLIKDDKFKKLVKSISEFPKMMELRPMVIDENNIVLGGNMRLKAIKELGFKEIEDSWVKQAKDLTTEEIKRFIIADNVGFGEHDWEILANEWDVEQLADWGLDIPDFAIKQEAQEDDYEIPDEIQTDIVLGDFFEIGPHRLLCGDSTQTDTFKALFGEQMADMVVTDPPYNVAYEGKTKKKLTIENDQQSDGDFYQFLYDFYTALGSYTKGGVFGTFGMQIRKELISEGQWPMQE